MSNFTAHKHTLMPLLYVKLRTCMHESMHSSCFANRLCLTEPNKVCLLSALCAAGNEDVQQERVARNPAAEQLRKDQLVEWWPTEELPTDFTYDDQEFKYDHAMYGGPVIVFKGMKEAMAASNGVSLKMT